MSETKSEMEIETMSEQETIDTPETSADSTETVDLSAEVEKWKSLSRKNEAQAKANSQAAKELDDLRKASQTDQEKLIAATREETALQVRREFAGKLVDAELKASLNGRVLDASAILSFDKTSFITDSGEIDTAALTAWVEAHTKSNEPVIPDLGQGVRGKNVSGTAQIRSRADLVNMTNSEILEARKDGRLDSLMGKN